MAEQFDYMGVQIDTTKPLATTACFVDRRPYSMTDGVQFPGRFEPSGEGLIDAVVEFDERQCQALASVVVARVYSEGDVRIVAVVDGADYYYNGASWVAATLPAHYNTSAQLEEALLDWRVDGGIGPSMGFRVTLTPGATDPVFYGMRMIWSIRWLSTTVTPYRGAGWIDDIMHRVLIAQLQAGTDAREWWRSREVVQTSSVAAESFDFSEYENPTTVIDAVSFDATDDPQLTTPLGAWDDAAKVLAYIPAIPSGHTRVDHYRIGVQAIYVGNRELVEVYAPCIKLGNLSVVRSDTPSGRFTVTKGGLFWSIRMPSRTELSLDVQLICETPLELAALRKTVRRLIDEGDRESPNTGERIGLEQPSDFRINGASDLYDATGRILITDVHEWDGLLETGTHTTEATMGLRLTDRGGTSWDSV